MASTLHLAPIRPARRDDFPAIVALYNHYVDSSAATFDVEHHTLESRAAWFAHFAPRGPYRLLVAAEGVRVLGYVASMQYRPKAGYLTSVETSVYCAPECTGQGLGERLYRALFEALRGEDLHRALAGVTLPGEASVALHRKLGFREVGRFTEQGRKHGRYWDVAWFERPLPWEG